MRLATITVVAVLAAGATACGDPGSKDASGEPRIVVDDRESVLQAAASTVDAGTARTAMAISVSGGPVETSLDVEGVLDLESGDGRLTMDMGSMADSMGLPAISADDLVFEVRMVDGVLYLRFPEALRGAAGLATEWVSVDVGDIAGADATSQFSQSDPTQGLDILLGVSDDVRDLGRDDVRGTPTRHYAMTTDLARLADATSQDLPEELRRRLEQQGLGLDELSSRLAEQLGNAEIPVEIWVDDEGRLRKMTVDVVMSGPMGADASMDMTIEFYEFGVAVDVDAPPAGSVSDGSSFLGVAAEGADQFGGEPVFQ